MIIVFCEYVALFYDDGCHKGVTDDAFRAFLRCMIRTYAWTFLFMVSHFYGHFLGHLFEHLFSVRSTFYNTI